MAEPKYHQMSLLSNYKRSEGSCEWAAVFVLQRGALHTPSHRKLQAHLRSANYTFLPHLKPCCDPQAFSSRQLGIRFTLIAALYLFIWVFSNQ